MKPHTIDDTENDLRKELTAGNNPDRIAQLEAEIDAHYRPRPNVSLQNAALYYASLGIPVFQLQAGRKAPLGMCEECKPEEGAKCAGPQHCGHDQCHGLNDATTDTTRIERWWNGKPRCNIGMATGWRFDVVDVDGPLGQASRAREWDNIFETIDRDSLAKILTPRPGGMHILVPPTGDGNSANIVPGVDYRGIGGYTVAPPSVILAGTKDHPGTYRFLGAPDVARIAGTVAA